MEEEGGRNRAILKLIDFLGGEFFPSTTLHFQPSELLEYPLCALVKEVWPMSHYKLIPKCGKSVLMLTILMDQLRNIVISLFGSNAPDTNISPNFGPLIFLCDARGEHR